MKFIDSSPFRHLVYIPANFIRKRYVSLLWRIRIRRRCAAPAHALTAEQKKEASDFFSKYHRISLISHMFYTEKTGVFSSRYIPDYLYYAEIDDYFNPYEESVTLDNKCDYPQIFQGIPQAQSVAYRMNGLWFTPGGGRRGASSHLSGRFEKAGLSI